MQNLFIKIRCVSWKQIFFSCSVVCISMNRAFRCQYALENKVCIPTSGAWHWYTVPSVYRILARALTYRADGIPTFGAVGKFAQSRYTGVQRVKGSPNTIEFTTLTCLSWVLGINLALKMFARCAVRIVTTTCMMKEQMNIFLVYNC